MRKSIIFVSLLVGCGLVWLALLLRPVSSDTAQQAFRIESGQSVFTISRNLRDQNLIRSSSAFEFLVRATHAESKVHAGVYTLSPHDNLLQIISVLTSGTFANSSTVTLIEGWDLKEYRSYLVKQGFSGDAFDAATQDIASWKEQYPFLQSLGTGRTVEGYAFPDTYAVDANRDAKLLIRKMLDTFNLKVSQELRDEIVRQGRSIDNVVILASIIEKEVAASKDRALVADIFLKRLKEGIPLQSDATVNYITGSGRTKSTAKDLEVNSPYNTYKYKGLPPAPIDNPSLDAIKAVIYPESNPYYYFLTDSNGVAHYAKTYAEQQKNKEKYL